MKDGTPFAIGQWSISIRIFGNAGSLMGSWNLGSGLQWETRGDWSDGPGRELTLRADPNKPLEADQKTFGWCHRLDSYREIHWLAILITDKAIPQPQPSQAKKHRPAFFPSGSLPLPFTLSTTAARYLRLGLGLSCTLLGTSCTISRTCHYPPHSGL